MRILKKIFIFLGIIFTIVVIFVSYILLKSGEFEKENIQFVSGFMFDFAESWEVSNVQHMLTNEFVEQIDTPNGRAAMLLFRQLGRLLDIQDIELNNYNTQLIGARNVKTGIFVFKAQFDNGSALVNLTLMVNENGQRVQALNINPTSEVELNRVNTKIEM